MHYVTDYFNEAEDQPSVYVLFHEPSRTFYIGYSKRPSRVMPGLYSALARGVFGNKAFQFLVRDASDVYHLYYPTFSVHEAKLFKRALTIYYNGSKRCIQERAAQVNLNKFQAEKLMKVVSDIAVGGTHRLKPRGMKAKMQYRFPKLVSSKRKAPPRETGPIESALRAIKRTMP